MNLQFFSFSSCPSGVNKVNGTVGTLIKSSLVFYSSKVTYNSDVNDSLENPTMLDSLDNKKKRSKSPRNKIINKSNKTNHLSKKQLDSIKICFKAIDKSLSRMWKLLTRKKKNNAPLTGKKKKV